MIDVTNYIVPPNSSVVPERAYVIVTSPNPQSSDIVLRISMNRGVSGGWYDVLSWPNYSTTYPEVLVSNIVSQQQFDVTTDSALPTGASILSGTDAPSLMVWDDNTSRFEQLDVSSIDASASPTVTINLASAPSTTIVNNMRISPYSDRLVIIAEAIEAYFDSLGPGEVVADSDPRIVRSFRYPTTDISNPIRAGQSILTILIDALGGVAPDAELTSISRNEPDLPGDIIDGPNMVTLGHVNIFPL
jgi:hypothetical protein